MGRGGKSRGGSSSRGRGGGATRGGKVSRGRGGKSGKRGGKGGKSATKDSTDNADTVNLEIAIEDVRGLFVNSTSFDQHLKSQNHDAVYYEASMLVLIKHKLELSSGSKARALAAAITRHDHNLMKAMLNMPAVFGMVEVTKALHMLDSRRQLARLNSRMEKLTAMKTELNYKVKKGKFSKLKNQIGNLDALKVSGSMSGAVSRHIRRWVKTIPKEKLEFYALHYPKEPWKSVADLVHLNSTKDFQLDWFLPYCFGGQAPVGTLVEQCSKITKENINEILTELEVPYAYLKQFKDWLNEDSKRLVAQREDLTTVIWWYEDLRCPPVTEVIKEKFSKGELLNFSYGKLMERIFVLQDFPDAKEIVDFMLEIAEKELRSISLTLDSPVAILGDKSASMQVCVKTSNIIASLLTMICDAHLNFFDNKVVEPPYRPTDVQKVLQLSKEIKAGCSTAPAASLHPFYEKKQEIKTFIVVTDEEENSSYMGDRFASLFKKYYDEVHKAKLVFVSFLRSQHQNGDMVSKLIKDYPDIQQFRFDQNRPDLTKLDNMLAILSTAGNWYESEVLVMKEKITVDGFTATFENLKL